MENDEKATNITDKVYLEELEKELWDLVEKAIPEALKATISCQLTYIESMESTKEMDQIHEAIKNRKKEIMRQTYNMIFSGSANLILKEAIKQLNISDYENEWIKQEAKQGNPLRWLID